MNRFRVNLHPAFFTEKEKESIDYQKNEAQRVIDEARRQEKILEDSILRRNNEALASLIETKEEAKQTEEEVAKQLETQLKQLAKNKKIDFPWTDNEWKCSRAEKRLATASARVFQQLLDKGKLQEMIEKCKSQGGELTKEDAESWGKDLGINSKAKDIQNFYKAYQEYQNPQSEFQHLKNLMGFFCESGFEDVDGLANAMRQRSKKISKKERNEKAKELYHEELKQSEYGHQYYEYVDQNGKPRPKDWKERSSFEALKDRLEKNTNLTDRMLTLLGDFNLDGEVNSGDVGYKTGGQIVDVFRREVATKQLMEPEFNNDVAVKNLVDYANKFGMEMGDITTVEGLYKWMTGENGYDNTKALQNFIRSLPIELGDVIKNGKDAGQESLAQISSVLKIEAKEREVAEIAAKQRAQDLVKEYEPLLKERIKDATKRANITQQLLSQLPGILMKEAKNMKDGLGAGVSIPLDQIIKGLSLGFNLGIDKDGNPHFGIYGARDRNFLLGKGFDMSTGASAGLNSFLIPCESLFVEFGYDVSEKKRKQSLDAMGINRVSLGANCTMYGSIFSWGISAGFENNKQGGIEKSAKNINSQMKAHGLTLVNAIKNKKEGEADANVLKTTLRGIFPESSDEELNKATNNILQIISDISIDGETSPKDLAIDAQVIADVYTEIWRNEALSGIADNKRKLSGGKVGIQFIAGYYPVPSLVAKFTKYYNARTHETEHSRIARIDEQVSGISNKPVTLEGIDIRNKVSQINEILKRYGAKSEIKPVAGADGKPGRIEVPVSIADEVGINVRVSENLKGKKCVNYIKNEGTGEIVSYSFPANTVYRILQETGGNQRSVTLNIGSDKTSIGDIMLSDYKKMEDLDLIGNNELTSGRERKFVGDQFTKRGTVEYGTNHIDSLFTEDIIEGLRTVDSSNRRKFSEFMRTKTDAEKTFDNMLQAVIVVLGKNKKYKTIVDKLSDSATSDEDKQLIVDRIMAISAEANVHNEHGLNENIKLRRDYYKKETMKGPNGQSIFDKLSVDRNEFIKSLNGKYALEHKQNVLGATAFYNRNNSAKGLALTGLGATNILGGKTQELTGDDKTKVKKWFLGGNNEKGEYVPGTLQKSPVEWSNLRTGVSKYIKDQIGEFKNEQLNSLLTDTQLKDLLEGKDVELTLDNSKKKVKVKIEDIKYVFYLMGECANESVGMELGNLEVQEQQEVDVYAQGELWLNNGDGGNAVEVSRKDRAFGITAAKKKKEAERPKKPTNKTGSEPGNGGIPDETVPEQGGEPIDETVPEQEGGPIDETENHSDPSNGNPGGGNSSEDYDNIWENGEQRGGNSATNDEYDDF